MKKIQYFGIKFPFTVENEDGMLLDLNESFDGKVVSQLIHVMLTSKGERIRMPDFGTDLMRFVFDPNDETTWDKIKEDARNSVAKYVQNATLNNVEVFSDENNEHTKIIKMNISIKKGNSVNTSNVIVRI